MDGDIATSKASDDIENFKTDNYHDESESYEETGHEGSINYECRLNQSQRSIRRHSLMSTGSSRKLKKQLGLLQGFVLLVGLILGSGIFLSPGLIAKQTSSTGMLILIWVVAGSLALLGSLCYCELGTMIKMAGGNYANVYNVYGDVPAFLCAWMTCLVIDPAGVAAVSLTLGTYAAKPFYNTDEAGESTAKIIAFIMITLSCLINCVSIKLSNRLQSALAVAQIGSVAFVVALGMWQLSRHEFSNFHDMFNGTTIDSGFALTFGIALFGGLWSYDGWAQMNNVVEEITHIERNLILTVITAFPFVIFCYIMVNISFLTLLSNKDMASSEAVGVEFVLRALGKNASYAMMILVALSSYGTLNGTVFACPRLTLAAAREGHMPQLLSMIHKRTGAPIPAVFLLTAISSLMLIPSASNLNSLILLFSQAQWLMYGASILGVVILRIRRPNVHRPFRVFIGIPMLMFLVAVYLVVIPFFRNFVQSVIVFGVILAGIPVYVLFIYLENQHPAWFTKMQLGFTARLQRCLNLAYCKT